MSSRHLPELLLAVLAVALLVAPVGMLTGEAGGALAEYAARPRPRATAPPPLPSGGYRAATCAPLLLVPSDAQGACRGPLLRALFTGLTSWDPVTGEAQLAVAESISTQDQQTWEIVVRPDWRFSDGTSVTARSFATAWNWVAFGPHEQALAPLLEGIEGYQEMRCGEGDSGLPDCVRFPPSANGMTGVEVVDDRTLRVRLRAPDRDFPVALGSTAFFPLPEAFYADPAVWARAPIGNGPFRADGPQVEPGVLRLVARGDHPQPPAAEAVEFRVYEDPGRALDDVLSGAVDVAPGVPPQRAQEAAHELGEGYREVPSGIVNYVGFPGDDPRFRDRDARRAVSLALNRHELARRRAGEEPATGLLPPGLPASRPDACRSACQDDVVQAARLWEQAGAEGPLTFWYNAGAGHEEWIEEARLQLEAALGVDVTLEPRGLSELLGDLDGGRVSGLYRLGWQGEYPSPQPYLRPLFTPDGPSNYSGYDEARVTELLAEAAAATDADGAAAAYQDAEDLVLRDMALVPVFFSRSSLAHSLRVSGVVADQRGTFDPASVRVRRS